jgi:hypothetical protein
VTPKATDRFASAPKEVLARLSLSDDECQVLACVGRVAKLGEILDRCGLKESQALDALLMLRAKGALLPVRRKKRPLTPTSDPPVVVEARNDASTAGEAQPQPEQQSAGSAEDTTRAEERRQRLARHPYLSRIKRQYRPS